MKICVIKNADAEKISDIYRVVNSLNQHHDCVVVSRNRNSNKTNIEQTFLEKNKNVPNYIINLSSNVGGGLKNTKVLIKYINLLKNWLIENQDKYDIIHAFDLDVGIASLLAQKKTRKPYVYHIADFYIDSRGGIPKSIEGLIKKMEFTVINKAETTIICTEQRKNQISGSHPKKLTVVHNSPATKERYMKITNTSDVIRLAYVGGLTNNRFIEEMLSIISDDTRFKLNIAGAGPLSDIVSEYDKKFRNIIYHGQLKYSDAVNLYKTCDIILSIYDPKVRNHKYSAPNKFYEAMMLSKSIIVANDTGVDKLVQKENIGYTIDYNKSNFKNMLEYIYKNRNELYELKVNSQNAYGKYSFEEMQRRVSSIYSSKDIKNRVCNGKSN